MTPHHVSRSPIRQHPADLVADRYRQIHLDFHTSEHIPDVGQEFDADTFAETLAEARVNWVTLFAKCHHGWSYYPSRVNAMHPALTFDLLGSQIEACRKRGIVTPAYLSVRVDEHNAHEHPEWRGLLKDGKFWKRNDDPLVNGDPLRPGWHQLCLNQTDYVEQLIEQALELLRWYDVEGLFFDMCYSPDPGCYCPRCYDGMKKAGLNFAADDDHRRFEYQLTRDYTRQIRKAIRSAKKNATVFFNCRQRPALRDELDIMTHAEVEALPTGDWGYSFFPIHARYTRTLGLPVVGMTGRFHKSWADFGGVKTRDQLLYEAGTILAAGGMMNIGDPCHPRGLLDPGAYEVIGAAFRHVEACEPWCRGAKSLAEIGVMLLPTEKPTGPGPLSGLWALSPAADGAGRMLLELKQQFDLIYPEADLSTYRLVILPDYGYLDPKAAQAVARFVKQGGALLVSHEASLANGRFLCPGLPVSYAGRSPYKPGYFESGPLLGEGEPAGIRVMYEASSWVRIMAGGRALGSLYSSYFNRTCDQFCSHFQTPPDRRLNHPLAVLKGRVAYVAASVFHAYQQHAYPTYKMIVANLVRELMPDPWARAEAPCAMEISVRRQSRPKRLVTHLVNFQPQRRHIQTEWIETIYPVRDLSLAVRTERAPREVYLATDRKPLPFVQKGAYCEVKIPEIGAHALVVFEGV